MTQDELTIQQIQMLTEMQENYRKLHDFATARVTETQVAAEAWANAEKWANSVIWDKNTMKMAGYATKSVTQSVVALSAQLAEVVKLLAGLSSDAGDVVTAKLEEICDREQNNP